MALVATPSAAPDTASPNQSIGFGTSMACACSRGDSSEPSESTAASTAPPSAMCRRRRAPAGIAPGRVLRSTVLMCRAARMRARLGDEPFDGDDEHERPDRGADHHEALAVAEQQGAGADEA